MLESKISDITHITQEQALELFESLDCVDLQFLVGCWQGEELPTGNILTGILTQLDWYGKEFIDADNVHPLLFLDSQGKIFKVAANPILINFSLTILESYSLALNKLLPPLKPLLLLFLLAMKTQKSQARLRMVEYHGQVTAAMIYDYLPIIDFFKKFDEQTVLGLMDWKLLPKPFFFILKRCP